MPRAEAATPAKPKHAPKAKAGKTKAPPAPGAAIHPGMGAILHANGVAFRVWAPHAESVSVKGEFNAWSDDAHPMVRDDAGYWYADIAGVQHGQGYKFHIVNGEQSFDRIDPYAQAVTNSVGVGLIHDHRQFDWAGDDFQAPPKSELMIYEMHIGSYATTEDGKPGTFLTALNRLGHLKKLGINCVQIMPAAEFAGDYSWGYNPAHIFAVESAYGGPDAFKTFVREAHKNGIAVILDVVYNHLGPSDLDLWRFDGWSENDGGGIYFYNDHRAQTPWGATRPDYGRGEVRQFLRDNALHWLREYHVDGLRFDMTLYMRSIAGNGDDDIPEGWSLMQWINQEVHAHFPGAITISEDLRGIAALTLPPDAGGAGFSSQWDANFVHPVREVVIVAEDAQRSMDAVRDALNFRYHGDAFARVVYSESHDEVANGKARVPAEINPDDATGWYAQKRSTLAAALVFTAPGVPMIFQGQEFLQGGWFRDDVPLDWDLNADYRGIVRLYRDLVQLRLNRKGHSRGLCGQVLNVFHVNDAMNVVAFQRADQYGAGDDVVVVMNFSHATREDYDIGLPAAGTWRLRVNSDAGVYSEDFSNHLSHDIDASGEGRDGLPASGKLSIGPYTALIYSQDPSA